MPIEPGYIVVGLVVIVCLFVMKKGKSLPNKSDMSDEDIKAMIREGNKINAIKYYRAKHGVGLTEAKSVVDKWEKSIKN